MAIYLRRRAFVHSQSSSETVHGRNSFHNFAANAGTVSIRLYWLTGGTPPRAKIQKKKGKKLCI